MKQFQVPQFIDVEDKILGPITMRQFFIILIPFGSGILLYFLLKLWLVAIIEIPITIAAMVFAFYKPYGMRFSRFFAAFLSYILKPRMYLWKRGGEARVMFTSAGQSEDKKTEKNIARGGLKSKKGNVETGSMYHTS